MTEAHFQKCKLTKKMCIEPAVVLNYVHDHECSFCVCVFKSCSFAFTDLSLALLL